MTAISREIGTYEITEQRLFDQARVVRTNEQLTGVELEETTRKTLTPRNDEENQKIIDIPAIEEKIQNESEPVEPNETEKILVRVGTEIADDARLFIDELKVLTIRNETEEYLPFKKVDQRKLKIVNKKKNKVVRHIEIDDVTQANNFSMAAALWVAKEVGVKKDEIGKKKSLGRKEELKVILPNWEGISTDWKGKDKENLQEKERERSTN